MCKTDIKKLPFGETVGRSFKYVLKNKELLRAIIPVVGVLTIIQILLGFPAMTSIKTVTLSHSKIYLGALSLAFAAIGIIINYCRSIVCKASVDYLSLKFWKRLGIYFVFAGRKVVYFARLFKSNSYYFSHVNPPMFLKESLRPHSQILQSCG